MAGEGLAQSNAESEEAFSDRDQTTPVLPCQKTCWIEIELLDQDSKPVAGEVYWLKTASGTFKKGKLDDKGKARVEQIECGTCTVRFPNIDDSDWSPLGDQEPPSNAWIEIAVVDEDDQAVVTEYEITDSAGGSHKGKLDDQGRARVSNLPEGVCAVRFPNLDQRDYLK